ncbi:MAG: uroporphyrinogen decarboxylase family protein [Chloroflexota bacterium]|nr:uroporphyrinogen decarboxylase [Chloroflexota bacterium]MBI5703671.1 uroporphyrinogen decarboxylase [Chloroflexota bacterium]
MTTHKERIQASLQGEIIDRPPVALWRHFPVDDQSPQTLAQATLHFQRTYDFDLVKVTPASSFCLKDWGAADEWTGHTEGTRQYTTRVIHGPRDWERLPVLDPTSRHLAAQLECLRLIRAELDPETPLIQTVFSPLAQAKNLAGSETLLAHLRLYPEAVLKGLAVIAETTRRFVEACLAAGIDGVFYAVQHAQASLLSLEEYRTFGLPNDLKALEPARGLWCNLLHLHGSDVYFSLLASFDFPIVNWHDRETPPSLAEAQKQFNGVVCGGMRQDTLVYGNQAEVQKEAADALQQIGGKRFILGTGCVVPVIAPHGNLMAARVPFSRWEKG